jgi:hypothetical protein
MSLFPDLANKLGSQSHLRPHSGLLSSVDCDDVALRGRSLIAQHFFGQRFQECSRGGGLDAKEFRRGDEGFELSAV